MGPVGVKRNSRRTVRWKVLAGSSMIAGCSVFCTAGPRRVIAEVGDAGALTVTIFER